MEIPVFDFPALFHGGHFEHDPKRGAHPEISIFAVHIFIINTLSFQKKYTFTRGARGAYQAHDLHPGDTSFEFLTATNPNKNKKQTNKLMPVIRC